ncbi:hypothetical protein BJY24_007350 [Nocardia transvalensis]|uniref:DUF6968 domain-containing protein n=1 Tax=Nocardia transvalensis TaxID=37333 RepID=A0A7W9UMB5_9NOCA|nr:hypothetical protein [Nocardia transvalensis]MBB5918438.1 hypothetical protein [Nocardia transvalensis]
MPITWELGEPIAVRTLHRGDEPVTVEIGRPRPYMESEDFFCPFRITGIELQEEGYTVGVDSVQALTLTLARVGDVLAVSGNSYSFLGGTDLGFPRSSG